MEGNSPRNVKSESKQIFQTSSSGRWQRFKWAGRLILLFLILGVVIFSIALSRGYLPSLPRIKEQSQLYKKVLDTNRTFLFKNNLIQQYGGFRKYINEKVPSGRERSPDKAKRIRPGMPNRRPSRRIPISVPSLNSRPA